MHKISETSDTSEEVRRAWTASVSGHSPCADTYIRSLHAATAAVVAVAAVHLAHQSMLHRRTWSHICVLRQQTRMFKAPT